MSIHKTAAGPWGCGDLDALSVFLGAGDDTNTGGRNRYHCSYVVFTDGTYYYAENGFTGELDYGGSGGEGGAAGTDFQAVIQGALNAMVNGGILFLKEGDFYVDRTITLPRLEDASPPRRSIRIKGSGLSTCLIPSASFADAVLINLAQATVEMVYGYELSDFTIFDYDDKKLIAGDYVLLRDIRFSEIRIRIVGSDHLNSANGLRIISPAGVCSNNRIKCWISSVDECVVLGDAADIDAVLLTDLTGCWFSFAQYGLDLIQCGGAPATTHTANWADSMLIDDVYTRGIRIATKDNTFRGIWFEDATVVEFTSTSENNYVEHIVSSAGGNRRHGILGGTENVLVDKYLDEGPKYHYFDGAVLDYFTPTLAGTGYTTLNARSIFIGTGAGGASTSQIASGTLGFAQIHEPWLTFKARITTTIQQTVKLGLWFDNNNYLWFIHDPVGANVNWFAVSERATIVEGNTDTGNLGDGNTHDFAITVCALDRRTIRYFMDGILVATHTLTGDFVNAFQVYFRIENKELVDKIVRIYDTTTIQGKQ